MTTKDCQPHLYHHTIAEAGATTRANGPRMVPVLVHFRELRPSSDPTIPKEISMLKLLAQNAAEVHVCGHRGHSIAAPENTIAALVATREHGGDSAEIDCVLTEDDEIV